MNLLETKKRLIANKMARQQVESPRSKEIRENNEATKRAGLAIVAKARHERRHKGGKRTTLEERKKWMDIMSKDS